MKFDSIGRSLSTEIHARWEKSQQEYRAEVMAALPEITHALEQLGRMEVQASRWHRIGVARVWPHLHEARELLQRKIEEVKNWESDPR